MAWPKKSGRQPNQFRQTFTTYKTAPTMLQVGEVWAEYKPLRVTGHHTVDGRNPKQPPGIYQKNLVNNGISYQPQLLITGFLPTVSCHVMPDQGLHTFALGLELGLRSARSEVAIKGLPRWITVTWSTALCFLDGRDFRHREFTMKFETFDIFWLFEGVSKCYDLASRRLLPKSLSSEVWWNFVQDGH